MPRFTEREKADEAKREVAMRKRVYGKKGHLTDAEARRILIMQEIADDYQNGGD